MVRFSIVSLSLSLSPQALAGSSVVAFDVDTRVTADLAANTITLQGLVVHSSCTDGFWDPVDLVSEAPIDPAFMPCEAGATFAMVYDAEGDPSWGLHAEIVGSTADAVTLTLDELLFIEGDMGVAVTTDLYGIGGRDPALPDLHAIWGSDGVAVYGTAGVAVMTVEENKADPPRAIWGTGGVAIWGTDSVLKDPLQRIVGTSGVLSEVNEAPEAYDDLPTTELKELVEKGIAVPLTTVTTTDLTVEAMGVKDVCERFDCN